MLSPPGIDRSPRILHVAETARGGVGTYLAELLPIQAARFGADRVRALVPASDAAHLSGVDRRQLVRWRRRGRTPRSLLALTQELRRQIDQFRPSVLHAHSSFAGLVVRTMLPRLGRPPIVYCPHGWGFDRTGRPIANNVAAGVERLLAQHTDRIVVISDHERREAIAAGLPAERLSLVHNGIADHAAPPASSWHDRRTKLLFVGRLDRQKGLDTLLDAVTPLADRVALRVIGAAVAGGGAARRRLANVDYLGWRSLAEVEAEIAAADVVVVPSRWEGFGLVALEAMRGGRAVLASAVGGLTEIVIDGVTGRLVPPDTPVALMQALETERPTRWRMMGIAGRRRFLEYFTAERMERAIAALYRDLGVEVSLADDPRPRPAPEATTVLIDA